MRVDEKARTIIVRANARNSIWLGHNKQPSYTQLKFSFLAEQQEQIYNRFTNDPSGTVFIQYRTDGGDSGPNNGARSGIRTHASRWRLEVDRVFIPFQPPVILSSDRGSAFKSELVKETCRAFGAELKLHVAWRPESTGVLERIHRVLKDCIFISCFERKISWLQALPLVTKALNVSFHKSIGVSPYEVIYGHKNEIGSVPLELRPNYDSSVSQTIMTKLNFEKISKTVARYQASTDKEVDNACSQTKAIDFEVGQNIFLKRPRSVKCRDNNFRFAGQYVVEGTNDSVVCVSDPEGNRDYVH